jgi:hypothetical protein
MKEYIYESPDGGKTVYRREFGNYDNRECIKSDTNETIFELLDCIELNVNKIRKELK